MNAGWKTVKLGDVARYDKAQGIHSGLPYVGLEHIESGTRKFIGSRSDMEVHSSTFLFNPNHVLYGRLRPYLRKVLVPDFAGHCSTEIFPILPSDDLDRSYLSYWLITESTTGAIDRLCNGARMPRANMEQALELEIPLPPLAEQKRIVALLDEAFAGIDEAKAKAVACQENSKLIFSNYLEAVFEKKGPDWAEVAISELCDVKHGYAFEGADFSSDVPDGNPLVVTPGNFTEDGKLCFNSKNSKRLRSNPPAEFKFNIGDLVVVMTDLSSQMKILGKPAFVETDDLLHNQRIGRLIFTRERVEKRLVYFFMMTQGYLKNIKITSTGTMVKHTAPKRITSNLISFPENRAKQLAIIAKLDELRKETQRLAKIHEDKKRALIELKSSLLSQAFSGELTA